ncbi:metallophosphoesterase family protein [Flexibacterium corallicola]|uniref:metallophosphoesterase family protein n=1 Tax=Flexibacterium corallicola TaxID=3037259 RepID=UPI00286F3EED|nr:metallophosphoesterase [Pseudovibrio sp. M1P-2-3]
MRILGFSDLHRKQDVAYSIVEESAQADVVVGAGDFAHKGIGLLDTLEILKGCRVPVVLVSGNHDREHELKEFCAGWELGHFLHGTGVELEGHFFFGLGKEVPKQMDKNHGEAMSEEVAEALLSSCPRGSVLVTHTPPYGIADLHKDGSHGGSVSVHDAVKSTQPVLNLCGHVHFAWGQTGRIGETLVHNMGPKLNWFEV